MQFIVERFMKNTSRIAFRIVFPASLLMEDAQKNGITHLLEHFHFRGNVDMPQSQLYTKMEVLNSPISGETTSQSMSFSFSSSRETFIKSFDLFCTFLFEISENYDDFAKEKSVVLREIEEKGADSFSYRMKKYFLGNHSASLPILGTFSGAKKITFSKLLYWNKIIETNKNAYCFLSGAFDVDLLEYVQKKLEYGFANLGTEISILPDYKIPSRGIKCVQPRWCDEHELAFAIYLPKEICSFYEFAIFRSSLCGGDGAIILRKLREEHGLCTNIQESSYYNKDYYILTFSCIVKKQWDCQAISDVLYSLLYMKNSLTEEEFIQANAIYTSDFDRFEEDPEVWNDFLFDYFEATGKCDTLKSEIRDSFASVTYGDFRKMLCDVIQSKNISVFAETYQQKCLENFYQKLNS